MCIRDRAEAFIEEIVAVIQSLIILFLAVQFLNERFGLRCV